MSFLSAIDGGEAAAALLVKLKNILLDDLKNNRDPLVNTTALFALTSYVVESAYKTAPDELKEKVRAVLIDQFENFCELVSKDLGID